MASETLEAHDTPEYVGTTLCFGDIEEVLLICHSAEAPSARDWSMLLSRLRSADFRVILVSTEGGAPEHAQLQALIAALTDESMRQPPTAVLSASPSMRWAAAVRQLLSSELAAVTLPFHALARARRLLEFNASEKRIEAARSRAHYLLLKRSVMAHYAHAPAERAARPERT